MSYNEKNTIQNETILFMMYNCSKSCIIEKADLLVSLFYSRLIYFKLLFCDFDFHPAVQSAAFSCFVISNRSAFPEE